MEQSDVKEQQKLPQVPEALAALEAQLTLATQQLVDFEAAATDVLNPASTPPAVAPEVAETKTIAPLAERIWMSVQTVMRLQVIILDLRKRLEV